MARGVDWDGNVIELVGGEEKIEREPRDEAQHADDNWSDAASNRLNARARTEEHTGAGTALRG